ncbi:MAG: hypothetical protein ABJC74_03630 [Gemmatimonadota bacterium]
MPLTRDQLRASFERAGDAHWGALIAHHEDAYPESRPTPGDIAKAEAQRLNDAGFGDSARFQLLESLVQRPTPSRVTITHRIRSLPDGPVQETEPFTNYE